MKKHIIAAQFAFATNILFPKIASAQNVKSDNMHLLEQIFLALNLIFRDYNRRTKSADYSPDISILHLSTDGTISGIFDVTVQVYAPQMSGCFL